MESGATTAWSIYPNPTAVTIYFTTDDLLNEAVTVQIYSVDGKLIRSETTNATTFTIDIAGEPAGTYLVRIIANETTSVQRIIKN